ncbi:MAG TPA: ATP-binding protein [Bryobacteraceae bacterium]|nr:ATP-binding protein [Bryobacteraceae bacterium]
MSLKARLRIAVLVLVTVVVLAMSALYLYDFAQMVFKNASERAEVIAKQVTGNLPSLLNNEITARRVRPESPQEWKAAWTDIIRTDPAIRSMLQRTLAGAELVVDILITDDQGKVLAAANPAQVGKTLTVPPRDFRQIQQGFWLANLWDLMTRREDYYTSSPIGVENSQVLCNVTVVIRSVLVRHDIQPAFNNLALAFSAALFIAIFLGSVLPNLILDPLQRVMQNIDLIRAGQFDAPVLRAHHEASEFAAVQSKLSQLGEQFRGAKQDALELRSNVDQLLQRLEEAVLLFDTSGRLVMAGEPAERLLGKKRDEIIGHTLEELFPGNTVLGGVIESAVRARQSIREQPINIARDHGGNIRLLAGIQVLQKGSGIEQMGTLITLRDAESRRQLELQLDISSRLAAISRLTGGVAHEIKNPLNAIALHLEVLRGKLDADQPEVEVITREIKRLDNVVKTFLNFNRPIELHAQPIDLNQVVEQVVALVSVEAQSKGIRIETTLQPRLWINGDSDLLKQAILNVVNNGLESMQEGGTLTILTAWDGDECQLTIADSGAGIAPDIKDRIFHLYFTTKEQGSGIGLATTFRLVQLHSGTIDFVSEQGKGTTFRFRFPGIPDYQLEATSATSSF